MTRTVLVLALMGLPVTALAAEPPALARARSLYNAGNYDAAIDAAATARRDPHAEDAAALVLARAHIERFRSGAQPADLAAAREMLGMINTTALTPRDQLDVLIGLGMALFFDQTFGAAADVFDTAMGRSSMLAAADRGKLLEWWATSLDRDAQTQAAEKRAPLLARIAERMQDELRSEPGSVIANYWLVVAARGSGDLDRAWAAAIAGWVRATFASDTAVNLRAELDKLVDEVLIPERSRAHAGRDPQETAAALRAEWEQVKTSWK